MLLYSGVVMAIEEPEFKIESKSENYEVRSYGPVLVAETTVEADFESAGNQNENRDDGASKSKSRL
jgi:uncharacterized protein YigE (DUF2233 family)